MGIRRPDRREAAEPRFLTAFWNGRVKPQAKYVVAGFSPHSGFADVTSVPA